MSPDPAVEALSASAVREGVFRSYQGVFEDQEEAFLLALLDRAAILSKAPPITSSSQLSYAPLGESRRANLLRRQLQIRN